MTHYGCHSKPRLNGYWAKDKEPTTYQPRDVWKWIENTMSRECRYDRQREDAKCEGCSRIVK